MAPPVPILLMVRELGPGGTERQLTEIAKHLDRTRFVPHVACFHPGGMRAKELIDHGIPVVHLPVTSFASFSVLAGARRMGHFLVRNNIRIVHTFDVPMTIFGVLGARYYRVPLVLSSQRANRELVAPLYRSLLRVSDRLSDAVVVNCAAIRDHLVTDYQVPEARIQLCYNGVDTNAFSVRSARPRRDVIIGGVYALRAEKSLETLLDAFARVHAKRSGTRLLIVGSGPLERHLRERAAVLGIEAVCRFEPSSADAAKWLREIDVFVLPSRSEALSNSLMEAMACGCACIASRVGGSPELIVPDESGLLFAAGDAEDLALQIEALVTNPEMRFRLAKSAAARIRAEFTVESAARRMGEIYGSLIS